MIHIFEHAGIHLHVDYTPANSAADLPTFHTVRVLDANYRPTGPDLTTLLHHTLLLAAEPTPGERTDAITFLSAIAADLP